MHWEKELESLRDAAWENCNGEQFGKTGEIKWQSRNKIDKSLFTYNCLASRNDQFYKTFSNSTKN